MKWQDMLAVAAVAAATMAFTLVAFGPAGVGAGDNVQTLRAEIVQPKLASQGCEFTLKTDKAAYQPGETPTIELTATNPSDKPVETAVWINITASSPRDMLSRMPVMPKPVWIHECKLTLQAGESKTVSVTADLKLPAGQSIAISMSDRDMTVMARTLSVPRQAPDANQQLRVSLNRQPAGE
jgi:hypothetical protein